MTARRSPWRFAPAALLGLALVNVSHADDVYRYKDPYGTWRTMTVPAGMARHYYTAQQRAAAEVGSSDCSVCGPGGPLDTAPSAPITPRIAELQTHPGLLGLKGVIVKASMDSGVDHALISAVIAIESGFRKDARSPKGALGLMQLMPQTALSLIDTKDVESALVDPGINVGAGARHLRRLIDEYPGRLDVALAAYNAGQGAVAKYAGIPPYKETREYVRDVMSLYQLYTTASLAERPARWRARH